MNAFTVLRAYDYPKDMDCFNFSNYRYYIISEFTNFNELSRAYNFLRMLKYSFNIKNSIVKDGNYIDSCFFIDTENGSCEFFYKKEDFFLLHYNDKNGCVCELPSHVFNSYNEDLGVKDSPFDYIFIDFNFSLKSMPTNHKKLYPNIPNIPIIDYDSALLYPDKIRRTDNTESLKKIMDKFKTLREELKKQGIEDKLYEK